jgi:hypothetical protein
MEWDGPGYTGFLEVMEGKYEGYFMRFDFSPEDIYFDSANLMHLNEDGFYYFKAGTVFSSNSLSTMSVKIYHLTRLVYVQGDLAEATRGKVARSSVGMAFDAPFYGVYDGRDALFDVHRNINEMLCWHTCEYYNAWTRSALLRADRYLGILDVSSDSEPFIGDAWVATRKICDSLDYVYRSGLLSGPVVVLSRNALGSPGRYRWRRSWLSSSPMLYVAQHAHSSVEIDDFEPEPDVSRFHGHGVFE